MLVSWAERIIARGSDGRPGAAKRRTAAPRAENGGRPPHLAENGGRSPPLAESGGRPPPGPKTADGHPPPADGRPRNWKHSARRTAGFRGGRPLQGGRPSVEAADGRPPLRAAVRQKPVSGARRLPVIVCLEKRARPRPGSSTALARAKSWATDRARRRSLRPAATGPWRAKSGVAKTKH